MTDRPEGPSPVPARAPRSLLDKLDERQLEQAFARLERESPGTPLLLDYLHHELPAASARAVAARIEGEEELKREAESLAQMVAAVREREARLQREAAPRVERMTESLMRRLAEEHARGDAARRAVGRGHRRRLGRIALMVASPLLLWLAMLVTPGVRDWWPLQPRWEVQRETTPERFDRWLDERTQLAGRGPLFLAVKRPGLGASALAPRRTTDVVVDAPELTVNYSGGAGGRLQLETPVAWFSTTDALIELRPRAEGGQLIQVLRGQTTVTLRQVGGRPIPIGAGAELALTATGAIDDTPPAPGSPFTRIVPEVP